MNNFNPFLGALAGVGLCFVSIAAQAREPSAPLAAYGRLPTLEDVSLSPDGTRVAYVKTKDDSRALYIVELSGKVIGGVRIGTTKLHQVFWQDNDRVLAVVSSTSLPPFGFSGATREWFQVVRYTISKNSIQPINFDVGGEQTFNVLTGSPAVREVDGKSVLFLPGYYVGSRVLPAMFSFGGDYGRARIIARGTEPMTDWLLDGLPRNSSMTIPRRLGPFGRAATTGSHRSQRVRRRWTRRNYWDSMRAVNMPLWSSCKATSRCGGR